MDLFQKLVGVWIPKANDTCLRESTPSGLVRQTTNSDSNSNLSPEAQTLLKVNEHRKKLRLVSLTMDSKLSDIAFRHSKWMNQNNAASHAGWETGRQQKVLACGFKNAGENLAGGECYDYQLSEQFTLLVPGWLNSPGHRMVIEIGAFTHTGIGISMSEQMCETGKRITYYATQIFGA